MMFVSIQTASTNILRLIFGHRLKQGLKYGRLKWEWFWKLVFCSSKIMNINYWSSKPKIERIRSLGFLFLQQRESFLCFVLQMPRIMDSLLVVQNLLSLDDRLCLGLHLKETCEKCCWIRNKTMSMKSIHRTFSSNHDNVVFPFAEFYKSSIQLSNL